MTPTGRLRGSATERGPGKYLVRVHVGNRKYKSRTVHARTRRQLEAAWRQFLNELEVGLGIEHGRHTVKAFAEEWLAQVERTREHATHSRYALITRRHIVPVIGHRRLDRLGHHDAQRCIDELVDAGKVATAGTCRAVLSAMCKVAVRRGLLRVNPAVELAVPRAKPREYKVLAPEQARSLLDVCRVGPDRLRQVYPVLALLLYTGLRRGEALGLRWRSVDLKARTIEVREQLKKQPGGYGLGDTKNHERRLVHLGRATVAMLVEHQREQDALRAELRPAYVDRGFVFTRFDARARTHGHPIAPTTLGRWFQEALQRAGLKGYRLHDLRDTHATLSLEQGVDLVTVSRRLGHSTLAMTADRYIFPRDDTQRDAAERLEALLVGETAKLTPKYEQSMNSEAVADVA